MDGLAEDADVVFVLTTNRADLLEPALAARPGRVDQAVVLDLPDVDARRALFELYRGSLPVDTSRSGRRPGPDRGRDGVVPQGAAPAGRAAGRDAHAGGRRSWPCPPATSTRRSTSCSTPATP